MRMLRCFAGLAVSLLVCLVASCSGGSGNVEELYSQFVHLPDSGWRRTVPCYFKPCVEGDGMELTLAIVHENEYELGNATMTVDVVTADTIALRRQVTMPLVDSNGNWTSDGFGSLYQCQVSVANGVRLDSTSVVMVWQTTGRDTLLHISDVGIGIIQHK